MTNATNPMDTIKSFILCFNENRIDDAIMHLDVDVMYHNIPIQPIHGRAAVAEFFNSIDLGHGLKTDWEIVSIASHGEVVLTERVDKFYREDGRQDSIPIMGCFRVIDGSISEWRDYFDLASFQTMSVLTPSED